MAEKFEKSPTPTILSSPIQFTIADKKILDSSYLSPDNIRHYDVAESFTRMTRVISVKC
jgi:hypothetical protein